MADSFSRRSLLERASVAVPFSAFAGAASLHRPTAHPPADSPESKIDVLTDQFPTQPPELVREMVTVSHFDLKRVQELVEAHPTLAKASWDWGFGDWEEALGAASHMGNRPIAEYLLSKGARPSLFSAAMLGQLDVVKAFIAAQPGAQRIRGPHSISLLAHARFGGPQARPVLEYLQALGDADGPPSVPLSEADQAAVKGIYVFGRGANQRIEVSIDKGQATWTRAGMTGRPLFHIGDRNFHPLGAQEVRIRFAESESPAAATSVSAISIPIITMTVTDCVTVLTATRKSEN
jgi:hypothetical protein